MFPRHSVPLSSLTSTEHFPEIVPGKPLRREGVKRKRGIKLNIAILDLSKAISRNMCKIRGKLVLITNRKPYYELSIGTKFVDLE